MEVPDIGLAVNVGHFFIGISGSQPTVESAKFHRWFVFRTYLFWYDDDEGGKQMDQKKIGNFISVCRKEKGLTQV